MHRAPSLFYLEEREVHSCEEVYFPPSVDCENRIVKAINDSQSEIIGADPSGRTGLINEWPRK